MLIIAVENFIKHKEETSDDPYFSYRMDGNYLGFGVSHPALQSLTCAPTSPQFSLQPQYLLSQLEAKLVSA